ncbi:MAG: YgfZ/GcvT domain-containing protein [Ignavibacteria bacterium]
MIRNRIDVYKDLFNNLNCNHNNKILSYSSVEEEYLSFYNAASIYDSSHSSIFYVTGKDSIDFLHRISTNDLTKLQDYSSIQTLFLNEKGRLIDRLKLLKFSDHLILIGSQNNAEKIYRWIERYAVMDDIKVKQTIENYLYLKILGKKSEIFFTLLFGDQLKNLEERKIYKYVGQDFQCWVIKDEILNEHTGYEIVCDEINRENLIKYIYSNLDIFNVHFIGYDAFEKIRVEFGEPSFPNEINDAFNPYEINLIKFVSFTKGCYIGQEVIARLDTYEKVKFEFCGFKLENDYNFEDKIIYKKDGTSAGELTSKTFSIKLNSPVALGVISKKLTSDDSNELFVKEGSQLIKISKAKLPMIDL